MSDGPPAGLVQRLLDVGVDAGDDGDLRNRKRVAAGAVYALLAFGLTWIFTGLQSGQPGQLAISLAFLVGTGAALGRFIATHDVERFIWWEAAIGLVTCAIGQVALGGFAGSSGSIVWGVITPIATAAPGATPKASAFAAPMEA